MGILDDLDLVDMGIRDPRVRRRLLEEASKLPSKLPHRLVQSPTSEHPPWSLEHVPASLMKPSSQQYGTTTRRSAAAPGQPPPGRRLVDEFDSLESWLSYLNLDFYAAKFRKYKYGDLEKVKKMWEAELTTILEITLPGHKKRILASIIGPNAADVVSAHSTSSDVSVTNEPRQQVNQTSGPRSYHDFKNGFDPSEDLSADFTRLVSPKRN
jgi:hypothetical protein